MPRLRSFVKNLCNKFLCITFRNFKINKKMYRSAAILYAGGIAVSVLSFGSTAFSGSGKNTVFAYSNNKAVHKEDEEKQADESLDVALEEQFILNDDLFESREIYKSIQKNDKNEGKLLVAKTLTDTLEFDKQKDEDFHKESLKIRKELIEYKDRLEKEIQRQRFLEAVRQRFGMESFTEDDYINLTKIVEAEAGGNDIKGKIIIANVILNRVKNKDFPNTVSKVIFSNSQFSPVKDGRLYSIKVSKTTKQAVDRALLGENNSNGALYFMNRHISSRANIKWFDANLKYLFSYGGHEFFMCK